MHVVIRQGNQEREVVIDARSPDAVLADLLDAAGQPDDEVDVDGTTLAGDLLLADAPIPDGSIIRAGRTPPPPPAVAVAEQALTVVAGTPAPARLDLVPGTRLRLGRAADNDLRLDCPTVSEVHALVTISDTGQVRIEDARSRNGTWLRGDHLLGPTPLRPGDTFRMGAVVLRLDGPDPLDRPIGLDRWSQPGNLPFNRPPRPALPPQTPGIDGVEVPDDDQRAQAFRIAALLAPLVMGGAMVYFTGNIRFALFMLMSPIMAISGYVSSKRQAKKGNKQASAAFVEQFSRFEEELTTTLRGEHARREIVTPDLAEVVRRARAPSVRLWERRITDDDLLHLRVGSATYRWNPPVDHPDSEVPDQVTQALADRGRLHDAVVDVSLAQGGVVGIVGDRARALDLARALVVQAAVLHGPADLPISVFTEHDAVAAWDWAKWLPHVRVGEQRSISADHATSVLMVGSVLDAHEAAQNERSGMSVPKLNSRSEGPQGPIHLWVVDDLELLRGRRAPLRSLLSGAAGQAAGVVIAPTEDQLPASCTVVVELLDDVGTAEVRHPARAELIRDVRTNGMAVDPARSVARRLARFEDPELHVVGGSVPNLVRLLPLLDMEEVTVDAVLARWQQGLPDPGPNGPIGVGEDGVVDLDLVRDGPHGLVGGTTGSGKSEFLRSMVAGMAARVDPAHLVFVLVDYKGGSAFDQCAGLPHTVGMVTDLDEHLGERALVSLEAELHHRERLFRDAGVTDLPEYLKAGATLGPCPRMVVVIDEFATMATELPDFLEALVGIAQRGRSLGVHLILATQRPKGAVNANIKANTNLRIALRVQDDGDSTDIIDTKDAAQLRRDNPGRAWIRRGHGDLVLVQSALSTGPAGTTAGAAVAIGEFTFAPVSTPPPPSDPDEDADTDLGLLVAACRAAYERAGIAEPRRPWLPMPSTTLPLDDILAMTATTRDRIVIGLADDPAAQAQLPVAWDLALGHLAVFGMVGSGTTTTLQTIGISASAVSPDRLHLYALDFGGGGLTALAKLPHCGAVVTAAMREEQFRLCRMLASEVDRRRELAAADRDDQPRILILVDDVGSLLSEHEGLEGQALIDDFKKAFAEGPGVGILFAVTGSRPAVLPMRMGSTVSQKLMLRHADPQDFGQIGVRPKQLPAFVAGRAVLSTTKQVVQIGLPGDLDEVVDARRGQVVERPPTRVASLPSTWTHAQLRAAPRLGPPLTIPVGLDDQTMDDAVVVLHPGDHVVVAGPPRSGTTSVLQLLSAQIRGLLPNAMQLAVADEHRSPLYGWWSLSGSGRLDELEQYLVAGLDRDEPWFVFVDDAPNVEDQGRLLERLVTARPGLHVIASGRAQGLRSGYGHWARPLRQSRTGMLLQPDLTTDGDLFGLRLPRRLPVPLVPGRGFLVNSGEFGLAQFALPADAPPPTPDG